MCLVFCAYRQLASYPLLLLVNRDERYDRPTIPLHKWSEEKIPIYAGRDEVGGGTWLGVSESARMAVLTNCRVPRVSPPVGAESRGLIPLAYLRGQMGGLDFLEKLSRQALRHRSFSLLLSDEQGMYYYHSPTRRITSLGEGVYGLSNAHLDTPWPKLLQGRRDFSAQIQRDERDEASYFAIMEDTRLAPEYLLPSTGLPYEREKAYSARCIRMPDYGTRSTTLVRFSDTAQLEIIEKTHAVAKQRAALQRYTFSVSPIHLSNEFVINA